MRMAENKTPAKASTAAAKSTASAAKATAVKATKAADLAEAAGRPTPPEVDPQQPPAAEAAAAVGKPPHTSDQGDRGASQADDAVPGPGHDPRPKEEIEQAQEVDRLASMGRAEAKREADNKEERQLAGRVCVVSDGTPHTGYALPGKEICSAHEMHYLPDGISRRKVHAAAQKAAEQPGAQVPVDRQPQGEQTWADRARVEDEKRR